MSVERHRLSLFVLTLERIGQLWRHTLSEGEYGRNKDPGPIARRTRAVGRSDYEPGTAGSREGPPPRAAASLDGRTGQEAGTPGGKQEQAQHAAEGSRG